MVKRCPTKTTPLDRTLSMTRVPPDDSTKLSMVSSPDAESSTLCWFRLAPRDMLVLCQANGGGCRASVTCTPDASNISHPPRPILELPADILRFFRINARPVDRVRPAIVGCPRCRCTDILIVAHDDGNPAATHDTNHLDWKCFIHWHWICKSKGHARWKLWVCLVSFAYVWRWSTPDDVLARSMVNNDWLTIDYTVGEFSQRADRVVWRSARRRFSRRVVNRCERTNQWRWVHFILASPKEWFRPFKLLFDAFVNCRILPLNVGKRYVRGSWTQCPVDWYFGLDKCPAKTHITKLYNSNKWLVILNQLMCSNDNLVQYWSQVFVFYRSKYNNTKPPNAYLYYIYFVTTGVYVWFNSVI